MPEFQVETFSYPLPFWLCCGAIVAFGTYFFVMREEGWGIPALAVLGTIAVWYVGDAIYNDYNAYLMEIGEDAMDAAWWQVFLFLCTFGLLVQPVSNRFNRRYAGNKSQIFKLMKTRGWQNPGFQKQLDTACNLLAVVWLILMAIALVRVDFDFAGLFAPYLGHKAYPWARGRIGSGFDSLIAFGAYLQLMLTAIFGVIAAITNNPSTRIIALVIFGLSVPSYLFERLRNAIVASVVPGFLAFVFLRLRGRSLARIILIAAGFLAMNHWLKFVMEARIANMNVAYAFAAGYFSPFEVKKISEEESSGSLANIGEKEAALKHEGLNMFQELSWINNFMETGAYNPDWGQRYFAEAVNFIPRTLWHGKPLIGIDYAIVRGMSWSRAEADQGGVSATISTGMIGQGVVNFGPWLGPATAALIMALWVAILARQDLLGYETPRLLLYVLGIVLTFNMGRDITLIVLYPFVFAYIFFLIWKRAAATPAGAAG